MSNGKLEIKKADKEKQIVMGEVYAPLDAPDAHLDKMSADEIEDMAHNFLKNDRLDQIDLQHDGELYGCHIVESFIARKGDDTFIEGAWVVGVYVPDDDIWALIKNGELNSFSMEAMAFKKEVETEMYLPVLLTGKTVKADDEDHVHTFIVKVDEDGNFAGGYTDEVNGHSHTISSSVKTDDEEDHSHRYSYIENIVEI